MDKIDRIVRTLFLSSFVVLATSCSKQEPVAPTEPSAALSPRTHAGLGTVQSALDSPAWRSIDALKFADAPGPATAAVRPLVNNAALSGGYAGAAAASELVTVVSQQVVDFDTGVLATIIPPDVLGTTFVFDPEQHRYVADPERTGAPENGVRYILYAVNLLTGEPVVDEEIGYADLTDESDEDTDALRLQAVSDGVTFVDYTVAMAGTADSSELAVRGTFFDGSSHLEFAIRAHGETNEVQHVLALHFHLAVPELEFALANRARAVAAQDGTVRAEQAVHIGNTTFAISSIQRDDALDATVGINGTPFADIHVRTGIIVMVRSDGTPLSDEEQRALGRLLGLFDGVSRMLRNLLRPIELLFALVPRT